MRAALPDGEAVDFAVIHDPQRDAVARQEAVLVLAAIMAESTPDLEAAIGVTVNRFADGLLNARGASDVARQLSDLARSLLVAGELARQAAVLAPAHRGWTGDLDEEGLIDDLREWAAHGQ